MTEKVRESLTYFLSMYSLILSPGVSVPMYSATAYNSEQAQCCGRGGRQETYGNSLFSCIMLLMMA